MIDRFCTLGVRNVSHARSPFKCVVICFSFKKLIFWKDVISYIFSFFLQGSFKKLFEVYSSGHLPESDLTKNHASLYKYCIPVNFCYTQAKRTVNTENISGMFIVF